MKKRNMWVVMGTVLIGALIYNLFAGFRRFETGLAAYCGVRTSDDRKEVLYRLGYPPSVIGEPEADEFGGKSQRIYDTRSHEDPKNAMPANMKIEDFLEWGYLNIGNITGDVRVSFFKESNQVRDVSCFDLSDNKSRGCPPLAGIKAGMSEESVFSMLGSPSRTMLDGTAKIVSYDDIGVEFWLAQGTVYMSRAFKGNGGESEYANRYARTIGF